MFVLAMFTVHAICLSPTESTSIHQETLAADTPLLVTATWGTAQHLADRVRVRGPDGALVPFRAEALGFDIRLVPEPTWPLGPLQVEERADYASDGHRLFGHFEGSRGAWFPMATVAVQMGPHPALEPPEAVVWSRNQPSFIMAIVEQAPPAIRWLGLEIDGVGSVALGKPTGHDLRVTTNTHDRCSCNRETLPIPPDRDVRVRVVAHGDAGATAFSPWTEIGPYDNASRDVLPVPIGQPADVSALTSWVPLNPAIDDRPLAPDEGGCGSLEWVGDHDTVVPPKTSMWADVRGGLHRVTRTDSGIVLDGREVLGVTGHLVNLVVVGASAFALVNQDDVTELIAIRGDHVVARRSLVGDLVELEPMVGGVGATVWERDTRVRHRQRFDHALTPLGPRERVLHPVELHKVSDHRFALNGVILPSDLHPQLHGTSDQHAVVYRAGATHEDPGTLVLLEADGAVAWTRELAAGLGVSDVSVDERGVLVGSHQQGTLAWDLEGTPVIAFADRVSRIRPETRTPWGDRTIVFSGRGLSVEQDGIRIATVLNGFSAIGFTEDALQLASVEAAASGEWIARISTYRCAGSPYGVPDFWRGP